MEILWNIGISETIAVYRRGSERNWLKTKPKAEDELKQRTRLGLNPGTYWGSGETQSPVDLLMRETTALDRGSKRLFQKLRESG